MSVTATALIFIGVTVIVYAICRYFYDMRGHHANAALARFPLAVPQDSAVSGEGGRMTTACERGDWSVCPQLCVDGWYCADCEAAFYFDYEEDKWWRDTQSPNGFTYTDIEAEQHDSI